MGKGGWHNTDTRIFAEDKLERNREKTGYSLKEPSCERKDSRMSQRRDSTLWGLTATIIPYTGSREASFQTSASLEGKINMGSLLGMMRVSKWMWEPRMLTTRWRSGCVGRDTERLWVQHGHLPAFEVTWHKLKKGFSSSYRLCSLMKTQGLKREQIGFVFR